MSKSSIWPIDRTLSGATTLGQSGPGTNDNEGVLHIPQSSSFGASPWDCLMSYILQPKPTGLRKQKGYLIEFLPGII